MGPLVPGDTLRYFEAKKPYQLGNIYIFVIANVIFNSGCYESTPFQIVGVKSDQSPFVVVINADSLIKRD